MALIRAKLSRLEQMDLFEEYYKKENEEARERMKKRAEQKKEEINNGKNKPVASGG